MNKNNCKITYIYIVYFKKSYINNIFIYIIYFIYILIFPIFLYFINRFCYIVLYSEVIKSNVEVGILFLQGVARSAFDHVAAAVFSVPWPQPP